MKNIRHIVKIEDIVKKMTRKQIVKKIGFSRKVLSVVFEQPYRYIVQG